MPPWLSEPSIEFSLTMTKETMSATAVDIKNKHPQSSNKPSKHLKKKSDEPTIYINLTTSSVSPKPCGQLLSPFKPKYPPASFPNALHPLLPPPTPTPSMPKQSKSFCFHEVFPDNDNSLESCNRKSTQKADDIKPDLKKLTKSFSVMKLSAGGKCDGYLQQPSYYSEEAQKFNESFCTAKT
ncbi:hypothetical protein ARMGADRAFT_1040524 [Armillaria gallica]|uniref:Uncharacterized protein n=1 Tax=Armillaria gallica TaxID=47427 RepID=A0A2H3CKT7_ARMGA|nr:hypothetical protein ARMGADRAFT_1040524 [Armillaria gallica]